MFTVKCNCIRHCVKVEEEKEIFVCKHSPDLDIRKTKNSEMSCKLVCIICFKSFIKTGEQCSSNLSHLLRRFFTVLERYFGRKISQDKLESLLQQVCDEKNDTHAVGLSCCTDCSKVVKSLCDLYHEMKCLELKLLWKFRTLKTVIKSGGRVPARLKILKEVCKNLEKREVNINVPVDCRNDLFGAFSDFRKEIGRKRSHHFLSPKVVLRRWKTPITQISDIRRNEVVESNENSRSENLCSFAQETDPLFKSQLSLIIVMLLFYSADAYLSWEAITPERRPLAVSSIPGSSTVISISDCFADEHSEVKLFNEDASVISLSGTGGVINGGSMSVSQLNLSLIGGDAADADSEPNLEYEDDFSEGDPEVKVNTNMIVSTSDVPETLKLLDPIPEFLVNVEIRSITTSIDKVVEEEYSFDDILTSTQASEAGDTSKGDKILLGVPTTTNSLEPLLNSSRKLSADILNQSSEVDKGCYGNEEEPRKKRLRQMHHCEKCSKTFSSTDTLEAHLKIHAGDKSFGEVEVPGTPDNSNEEDHQMDSEGDDAEEFVVDEVVEEEEEDLSSSGSDSEHDDVEDENKEESDGDSSFEGDHGFNKYPSALKKMPSDWLQLEVLDNGLKLADFLLKGRNQIFKYRCAVDTCQFRFTLATELEKHSQLHGQFKCNFCNVVESYAPDLAFHEVDCTSSCSSQNAIPVKNLKRSRSRKVTANNEVNISNKDSSNSEPSIIKCSRCPCKFNWGWGSKVDYIIHYLNTHLGFDVPLFMTCPLCRKQFYNVISAPHKGLIVRHMLSAHDVSGLKPSQIHICQECPTPVNFRRKQQLCQHRKETHHESTYTCSEPECAGLKIFSRGFHMFHAHRGNPESCPWVCTEPGCTLRFTTKKGLDTHSKQKHASECVHVNGDRPFACDKCEKTFNEKYRLEIHKLTHGDDYERGTKYACKCPECPEIIPTFAQFRDHLKTRHAFTLEDSNFDPSVLVKSTIPKCDQVFSKYQCKVHHCSVKFNNQQELDNHMQHHGNFACNSCQKVVKNAIDLALHELQHCNSEDDKVHCQRCTMTFNGNDYGRIKYGKHFLQTHLSLPWANILCSICQEGYLVLDYHKTGTTSGRRTLHFQQCHDVSTMDPAKIAKCDKCPAYFKNFRQLHAHQKDIHKAEANICGECGRKLRRPRDLELHLIKIHSYDPTDPVKFPVPCRDPECSQRFISKDFMERHANYCHTNKETNHKCPRCQKVFFGKHAIDRHMQSCGRERLVKRQESSHICETCGKAFTKERLAIHRLVHLGPDAWKFCCETCGKKCMTKQKLTEHLRTHTQEKLFQCSYCGGKYAHRHNLRHHVSSKHPDMPEEIVRSFDKTNLTSRKGIPIGKRPNDSDRRTQLKKGKRGPTHRGKGIRNATHSSGTSDSSSDDE